MNSSQDTYLYNRNRYRDNEKLNCKNEYKNKKILKVCVQLVVCACVYWGIYAVNNNNYAFSKEVQQNIDEILNVEVDLNKYFNIVWNNCVIFNNKLDELINKQSKEKVDNEENSNEENKDENITNSELGVGGSNEEILNEDYLQMDIDAKYIRDNYQLVKPVDGIISSRFGLRTPSNVVSENHHGIDIANDEGTKIKAALDGNVVYAGFSSSFGNYIKIQKDDIVIIYGHCKNLYIKTNDNVIKGQEIAEVGHTGNATGPHLHFEIRRENRVINPELVMEF